MKTKLKAGISIGIIVIILIVGLFLLNRPKPTPKYCKTDDDCVTSCGSEIGRGDCYNKAFLALKPGNPPDHTCCMCEDCRPCITCECINNVCMPKRTGGDCCFEYRKPPASKVSSLREFTFDF